MTPPGAIWAETLNLKSMTASWGSPQAAKSVGEHPITLQGVVYPHGIGTHAPSQMTVDLKDSCTRFAAMVGVDDEMEATKGQLIFSINVDGKKVATSHIMRSGDPPELLTADLKGAKYMIMDVVGANGDTAYGHADWAGAVLELAPETASRPVSLSPNGPAPVSPLPLWPVFDPHPAIHGPRVVGFSPRRPFLFLVPATGKAPLTYSSNGLPQGLVLDPHSGIITGHVDRAGAYPVQIGVSGPGGKMVRGLTLVCGDHKLALTPPMGWNSWNVFGDTVTGDRVRDQADWMIKTGLAAHGWQYMVVDDTWQGRRFADGTIGPNRRMGDLKSLADYIHSKGLKFGLMSSPTDQTCSGFTGSAGHETSDAQQYAAWGVDFLKYDWCQVSTNTEHVTPEEMQVGYGKMRTALDGLNRDIVYNLTPYGFGDNQDWGQQAGANSWTVTAPMLDRWEMLQHAAFEQDDPVKNSGPGHWCNMGWLQIGRIGVADTHFSHLKPSEQMSQLTMWSLLASPLMISCDLSQLDPNLFYPLVTSLLTNDEVLDIDQDPLGHPAERFFSNGDTEIWRRPLWDGTTVVGIFNKQLWTQKITVKFADLGLGEAQPVRDLWQHRDLGLSIGSFTGSVPRHGVLLIKIGKPNESAPIPTVAGATVATRA